MSEISIGKKSAFVDNCPNVHRSLRLIYSRNISRFSFLSTVTRYFATPDEHECTTFNDIYDFHRFPRFVAFSRCVLLAAQLLECFFCCLLLFVCVSVVFFSFWITFKENSLENYAN